MKTLDDVIEAMERCSIPHYFDCKECPYEDDDAEVGCRSDDRDADALHYLKLFQAHCERVRGQLEDLKQEYRPNDPLTWDELRHMEGKPVWVEYIKGDKRVDAEWIIIKKVKSTCIENTSGRFQADSRGWSWQAYRKERSDGEA